MEEIKSRINESQNSLNSNKIAPDTPLISAARKAALSGFKTAALILGLVGSLALFTLNGYIGALFFLLSVFVLLATISINSALSFKHPLVNLKGLSRNAFFLIVLALIIVAILIADCLKFIEPIKAVINTLSANALSLVPIDLGALGTLGIYLVPLFAVLTLLGGFNVVSIRAIIRKNRPFGFFSLLLFIVYLVLAICSLTVTASIVLKFFNIVVTPDITVLFGNGYAAAAFYFLISLGFIFAAIYYINLFVKTEKIKNAL